MATSNRGKFLNPAKLIVKAGAGPVVIPYLGKNTSLSLNIIRSLGLGKLFCQLSEKQFHLLALISHQSLWHVDDQSG